MEGFKDLFWKGDAAVWKNFLRHYLLCLMQIALSLALGAEREVTPETLPVEMIDTDLSAQYRALYDSICATFFEDAELADLPALLAGRASPIRRAELLSILLPLHARSLNIVFTTLSPNEPIHRIDELLRARVRAPLRFQQSFAAANQVESRRTDGSDIAEQMTAKLVSAVTQAIFIQQYNAVSQADGPTWNAIMASFPELYLNALERLLYFDWYLACFVADPTDTAMWGTYGDGHKGACLKFKTSPSQSGKSTLTLRQLTGFSGALQDTAPNHDFRPLELQEVNYCERYTEIDFFRSLGRLAAPRAAFWFRDGRGSVSEIGKDLLRRDRAWLGAYWNSFETTITTKLKDWQHEREYRLTLHSMIADLSNPAFRKLNYRFDDLQGIIFGIKTSNDDKRSIVRIIKEKCKREGRNRFEIHQAYYSRRTGRIEIAPWDLLRWS